MRLIRVFSPKPPSSKAHTPKNFTPSSLRFSTPIYTSYLNPLFLPLIIALAIRIPISCNNTKSYLSLLATMFFAIGTTTFRLFFTPLLHPFFTWIKSHANFPDNDTADAVSK